MRLTWGLIWLAVILGVMAFAALDPRAAAWTAALAAWLRGSGAVGMAAYAAIYAGATALGWPLTWSAALGGFLYGATAGAALSWPAAVLGATGTFLLGRGFFAEPARRLLQRPRFAAVEQAVVAGGPRMIALMRLMPIAQNVMSFALGASRLRPGAYVLGTALGTAPLVAFFAWAGSFAADATEILRARERVGGWAIAFSGAGLVAGVVVVVWIVRRARAALRAAEARSRSASP